MGTKPKFITHSLCCSIFFLFSTTRARFPFPVKFPSPFPQPTTPVWASFLVISEIILLNNTICIEKAEHWEEKKIPEEYNRIGDARRKSLQTPLNVNGSRITHILGAAEPLTPKRYKNGPWRSSESSYGDLLMPKRPKRYESPKWYGEQPVHFCKKVSPWGKL